MSSPPFASLSLPPQERVLPVDHEATIASLFAARAFPATMATALVLVPDRTRSVAIDQWLPPLIAQFRARGAKSIRVLFASGTHAPMTASERTHALGLEAAHVEHAAHDCDAQDLVDLGGGPLHPWIKHADALVVISQLTLHYLAGVGGGRKMLFPGVTSRSVARAIHRVTVGADGQRPPTIAAGVVEENPMHRAIMKRVEASALPPHASLVVQMRDGQVVAADVHENLGAAFVRGALRFVSQQTLQVPAALDGIWARCPAATGDNLVQAHKSLQAVSSIVRPKGRIVVEAPLARGTGNPKIVEWLTMTTTDLAASVVDAFEIGKQTALSFRRLLDAFDVAFTGVDPRQRRALAQLGLRTFERDAAVAWLAQAGDRVAFTAHGASVLYRVASSAGRAPP